jgi:hypothetical protein
MLPPIPAPHGELSKIHYFQRNKTKKNVLFGIANFRPEEKSRLESVN